MHHRRDCSRSATGRIFGVMLFFIVFYLATESMLSPADSTLFSAPSPFQPFQVSALVELVSGSES